MKEGPFSAGSGAETHTGCGRNEFFVLKPVFHAFLLASDEQGVSWNGKSCMRMGQEIENLSFSWKNA